MATHVCDIANVSMEAAKAHAFFCIFAIAPFSDRSVNILVFYQCNRLTWAYDFFTRKDLKRDAQLCILPVTITTKNTISSNCLRLKIIKLFKPNWVKAQGTNSLGVLLEQFSTFGLMSIFGNISKKDSKLFTKKDNHLTLAAFPRQQMPPSL